MSFNEANFWSLVNKTDNCWLWQGYVNKRGYGEYSSPELTTRLVHRIAYALVKGWMPSEALDHLCRERSCCNPGHLEPVSNLTNVRRSNIGQHWANKTHCPQGHPYDEENTIVYKGSRFCKACKRERNREYMRKKRKEERETS